MDKRHNSQKIFGNQSYQLQTAEENSLNTSMKENRMQFSPHVKLVDGKPRYVSDPKSQLNNSNKQFYVKA